MASKAFHLVLEAADKGLFPKTRKWGWQRLYNLMSRFWPDGDWRFMNYGFQPDGSASPFPLETADEPERAFIGLYHQAVDGLDLAGKRVLEVGCGRGGGTAYIARYFEPAEAIGVDYSQVTVARAKKLNSETANVKYQWGDAENLPFPDASFDVVVNIESSHCYADMSAFVREAERVLKPGGIFTWADMRGRGMLEALDACFAQTGLECIHDTLLSDGVVRALDDMNARKVDRIRKIPLLSKFFLEFAGTHGSQTYRGLTSGKVLYLARRYRKKLDS